MQTIYGVALGPGDPELLTLKALRVLKESDVIFYPGSIKEGKERSFSYPILQFHGLETKKLKGFFIQMSDERKHAEEVYENTAKDIEKAYNSGQKIVVVCEGDISLYASFSYLLAKLKDKKLSVSLVPGVNSFSLGAAQHQVPLSLLHEKVAIIPRVNNIQEINHYFQEFDTLILMKIRSVLKAVQTELEQKEWNCYYCEYLGTDQEYITTDLQNLTYREIPYFSLLIIKK